MGLPTGTVTFVFTDIEGSTALLDRLGPQYGAVLHRHHEIVRAGIGRHGGVEVSVAGDGFFVAFPTASGAVEACLEIQLELSLERWPGDAEVRVRMGLHAGEADVVDDQYLGMAIHEAARISAAGHGGQVLLSRRTAGLAAEVFSGELSAADLGEHRLKDISEPVPLCQLVHPGLPSSFPPIRTTRSTMNRLPDDPTPLLARAGLVDDVVARLASGTRLLTLVGPGGIGKTRVGIAVARAFQARDGEAWFAPLASVDTAAVPTAVAAAVEADLQGDVGVLDAIVRSLRGRRGVLVLDNFEHVKGAAPLVSSLLERVSGLAIVVTSREPLRLAAEVQVAVPPLDVPPDPAGASAAEFDAVRLFLARAAAVSPSFEPTPANVAAVARVCRRLDGIPLALELAAGQLRAISARELVGQIDVLDVEGAHDLPGRHRTLRETVRWSYDLLDPDTAHLLRRAAVFVGGWSAGAAARVCGDGPGDTATATRLAALVDASLVRRQETDDGSTRYDMLETVRAFAVDELVASGEGEALARAHATRFVELAEQAAPALAGPEAPAWCARLALERPNLRAAFDHLCERGDRATALRLVRALVPMWTVQGELAVAALWIDEVMAVGDPEESTDEAVALACRAEAARRRGDPDTALRSIAQALTAARAGDDAGALHAALLVAGRLKVVDRRGGRTSAEEGDALLAEAEELARQRGDDPGLVDVLVARSRSLMMTVDTKSRREVLDEAAELAKRIDDRWRLAQVAAAAATTGVFTDPRAQAHAAQLVRELGDVESELELLGPILASTRTPVPLLRSLADRQVELATRAGATRALLDARMRQASLAIGDSRPDDRSALVAKAVAEAEADPSFPADHAAAETARKLRDAAHTTSFGAGQLRAVVRSLSSGGQGQERDRLTRMTRWAYVYGMGCKIGVGTAALVAATALAVFGSSWAWVLGAVALSFPVGLLTVRRSDHGDVIAGVGAALVLLVGPFDWGALLVAGIALRAALRTAFPRADGVDRVASGAVAVAAVGVLAAGHARPGAAPVVLLLLLEIVRHRGRAPATVLLRTGALLATLGLALLVAVAVDTSVGTAASDRWLVAMTVGGGLVWSAGVAAYGGPFRPAGWAFAVVALTSVAAQQQSDLAPTWGVLALAVAWAAAGAGLMVKTGDAVSYQPRDLPAREAEPAAAAGTVPPVA